MNKKSKISIILSSMLTIITIPTIALSITSCSKQIESKTHTSIENEVQQYANDNSISLGFAFQPNYDYVLSKITSFFDNSNILTPIQESNIVWSILQNIDESENSINLLFGTSWMIDYKINSLNNINTYYLATNTHVLDLSYTIQGKFNSYSYEFNFPINSQSVNYLRLFLSQPQGNLQYNASYNDFLTSWYATDINKNNINENIIQYTNNTNESKFDFSFNYSTFIDTILVKSDNSSATLNKQISQTSNTPSLDSSILKLELNPNDIKVKSTNPIEVNQINKLKRIFDVNELYVNKSSNYISKLNNTYELLQNNKIIDFRQSPSFPFNLGQEVKELTVGGFPGDNKRNYTYFNTGTTNLVHYNKNVNREYIRFLNGNQFSFSKYDSDDTAYLGGINLMPGSSGSMVLDNNNKIVGIYWGALSSGEYGLFIPFEVKNNSLWNRLSNFIKTNDEFIGSKLRSILNY